MKVLTLLVSTVLLAAPFAHAQHWFDAPLQPIATPPGVFVLHGDLDGDGDEDLLGGFGSTLHAVLGDGAGGFAVGASIALGSGEDLHRGALLDLDGDGALDLALPLGAASPTSGVVIRRGLGDATFAAPVTVTTPGEVRHVERGHADGDAAQELAVFCEGTFPEFRVLWIDWSGGQPVAGPFGSVQNVFGVHAMAALDLDGDGDEDFALSTSNLLELVRTDPGLVPVPNGTVVTPFSPGAYVELAAADLDGDGDEDLLGLWPSASVGESRIVAFENAGPGVLVAGPTSDQPALPYRFHLGDWDGDGDLDVVATDAFVFSGLPQLHQVENLGGFDFAPAVESDLVTVGQGAGLADFDGDGFLDLCSPLYVVFGDGTFAGPFGSELGGDAGTDAGALGLVDFEPDGDLDAPVGSALYVNDGGGNLAGALLWPELEPQHFYAGVSAYADFTGDGRRDYLARTGVFTGPFTSTFAGMRLIAEDGLGGYADLGLAAPSHVDFGASVYEPRGTADVDGDGDLDLLLPGAARLNDGSGALSATVALPTGAVNRGLDVDGDGDDDVIVLDSGTPSRFRLLRQIAPLAFEVSDLATIPAAVHGRFGLPDVDGDGLLDLAACELGTSSTRLHLLRGSKTGFDAAVALPVQPHQQQTVGADDVDGDGVLDLLAGSTSSPVGGKSHLLVYRGLGAPLAYEAPRAFFSGAILAFGDLDGDGDVDAVGQGSIAGQRFDGAADGQIQQYGAGTPGSGGAVPVLGASGPVRPGSHDAALHAAFALGGTGTFLAVAGGDANLPGFPLAGLTSLVDPGTFLALLTIPTSGAGAGAGGFTLPIPEPIVAALAGLSIYHQVMVLDPGAGPLVAQSNGVEILYGR